MGLPEINILFKTRGLSFIQRSNKGIVSIVLKDEKAESKGKYFSFKNISELKEDMFNEENLKLLKLVFKGLPKKVDVHVMGSDDSGYSKVLTELANKRWNYLAIPKIEQKDVDNIATFIKSKRKDEYKSYKAVLPNSPSDDEGIINFISDEIKVKDGDVYDTAQYTTRVAGLLAGMRGDRSATYYVVDEVESVKPVEDVGKAIDNGQLVLMNDGEKIKIARGVNSLTTISGERGKEFSKIRIVDNIDTMRDDIRQAFEDEYVGKVVNTYDNKMLLVATILYYFKQLERIQVLDPTYNNLVEIDEVAQMDYLRAKGYRTSDGRDVDSMTVKEIKEANTGEKVFLRASVKFTDTMEDIDFIITL